MVTVIPLDRRKCQQRRKRTSYGLSYTKLMFTISYTNDRIWSFFTILGQFINRLKAAVVAYEYLVGHPAGRDPNTNVILVKQGREPPIFTGWFMAWDPHMWANGKSYDQVRAEMGNDDLFKTIELKDISNNTPAAVQGSVIVMHVSVPR